jgi:hypothetical protein
MVKKYAYQESLKQDSQGMIDTLKLQDLQKSFLIKRWLNQVMWMEGRSGKARNQYYRLRLITIIGGVIVPAIITFNTNNNQLKQAAVFLTFGLSQAVAISAALEEFFHYGERWRYYRRTSESLKTQGWQFFQLSGPYVNYTNHKQAFRLFASQVEDIIQRDVEIYATQVVQDKKQEKNSKNDLQEVEQVKEEENSNNGQIEVASLKLEN